ncbi:hypothetical protein H9L10_02420 [Phycicoccus endophyticus]|uniref:Uncharacterized protein n=1 Tax=Phycicoccus endophyticus TaxID=1690220 RepID=A0A7G9R2X9_9MICO|nr:hypothetical protein [Phycicoccus endophyticus]NHI20245.1 hypothetical protein [Phycicoccus endophyticus]QNN49954.1 hypothetical protein H9L10_02420 [Phycicoccus endophyticus]GGL29304.1 hypothetical protein GCM10012283_09520 [Phycicoccus endophyticus]
MEDEQLTLPTSADAGPDHPHASTGSTGSGPQAPTASEPGPQSPSDPSDPDPDVEEPWTPHEPDDPAPVAPNPAPGTGDDPQPRRQVGSSAPMTPGERTPA